MNNNTVYERKNVFYREFTTEKGEKLVVIEPGYIINMSTYLIFLMIENNTTYDDLILKVQSKIKNSTLNQIEKIVDPVLDSLIERNIIAVKGKNFNYEMKDSKNAKMEIDLEKEVHTTVITQVDLVVTTECNFRCRHCFINEKNINNICRIDLQKWKDIIDKLCNQGLISIVVTGGEPFVYSDLPELLVYANKKGLSIQILTNGYLIDDKFIKKIEDIKNLVIQVSLDGSNSLSNNFQRNKKDAFEKTTENIKSIKKVGKEVIVAMVLNRCNVQDIYDGSMVRLCENLGVNVLAVTPAVINIENAKKNEQDFLSPKEMLEVIKFIKEINEQNQSDLIINLSVPPALAPEMSLSPIKKERSRCRRGTNSFSIRPNGDVCVCSDFMEVGYKEYELGNFFDIGLNQIVNKLGEISKSKNENKTLIKGVCSICKELPFCGGACRADAYAAYNDILAPYSVCQRLYESNLFPENKLDRSLEYKDFIH